MSSGCGDVVSLESMQIARKHQIFEIEVITGKSGGVAGGADIDYATNAVTGQLQKTLPAVLRDAGFRPASFTFETGGTIGVNDADLAVLWPISSGGDGNYYAWKGSLPKTIPAASTPNSTGGVSNSAWKPITDSNLRNDISNMRNTIVGGSVFPPEIEKITQIGDSIPSGTSFLNTAFGLLEMQPQASGAVTAISREYAVVGGVTVFLREYNRKAETYLSEWTSSGSDVSALLNALVSAFKTIYIDIPVSLSNNVISSADGVRIIGIGGAAISLTGSAFDTTKGAIELTGNYTEVSGVKFNTVSTSVTPLRMGNTSYGSTDSTRREGIKSNSCTFDGTGFKGANHGNFIVIGAIHPEITFPRFIGQSRAGGNMEILGVKGGYVSEGYAENGLLINYHATSADGTGFPTTDFKFIDCEGVMNSSVLGSVDGAVGGNNNIKFSRGCTNCKIIGGKFTSVSNGAFNGNDHVVALQGCSNNRIENVQIFMQNNGDFKSAYGFFDHQISLTDCLDNVISGGMVTINTPGQYNRICNVRSDFGKSVRRNRLENVTFNCYNGSNTVDAVLEQYSSTSGMVSDQQVTNCSGLGVSVVLRNRDGLASSSVTYLGMNRIGTVYDTYTINSGVVKLVSAPCVVNINSSGALALAVGCTATKSSVGIWVINFPTDMSRAGYTFSSPGTGRYVVVNKTSTTSWTITTYNNLGVISDLECSIVVQ